MGDEFSSTVCATEKVISRSESGNSAQSIRRLMDEASNWQEGAGSEEDTGSFSPGEVDSHCCQVSRNAMILSQSSPPLGKIILSGGS